MMVGGWRGGWSGVLTGAHVKAIIDHLPEALTAYWQACQSCGADEEMATQMLLNEWERVRCPHLCYSVRRDEQTGEIYGMCLCGKRISREELT
jgi:hypothetical protein